MAKRKLNPADYLAQWQRQLADGLEKMAITLSSEQQRLLLDYLALLVKWNQAYNLTAIRNPEEMVSRQLLDSLSILKLVKGTRVLDVGTGPGLPGIVLAISLPHTHFTLIDSNGKKTRFVQQAISELKLPNAEVKQLRVEELQVTEGYDTITSRAFAALPKMVELTRHLLAEGGQLLAMKGTVPQEEMDQVKSQGYQVEVEKLQVPDTDGERHAIILL
jgi:16S rRNA (guanine527-N7)-methyltransferase